MNLPVGQLDPSLPSPLPGDSDSNRNSNSVGPQAGTDPPGDPGPRAHPGPSVRSGFSAHPGPSSDPGLPLATQASVASLEQAARWYATLRDENASEQDHAAWRAWLARSAEHAGAWQYIEAVSRRFDPLRGSGASGAAAAAAGVKVARQPALKRRRLLNGLAGAAGLGLVGWLGWRHTPLPEILVALGGDQRTGTGERRELGLDDGSRVWLNTRTSIQVDYQDRLRRLVLLAGEILIETAPDPQARPFYVQTRPGRLQALGTRFTVQLADHQIRLDVFDGAVEILTRAGETGRIEAGQAARFDARAVTPLGSADRVRAAWTRGRLPADHLPLGELLAELGRYRHGHISVAPEVAGLKVMGVYPTDDTDRALIMLEQSLPIRVRRPLPWWTTVEAR